jgi:hypothetical protein
MYIHVFLEFLTFLTSVHVVYTKTWFAFDMLPLRACLEMQF